MLVLASLLLAAAHADEWTVCDDAIAPFTTIQDAVDAGQATITICPGTYEPFDLDGVTDMDIVGAGEADVLVTSGTRSAMSATDSTFTMSGLTLTGYGRPGRGAAIDVHMSTATIENVTVRDCRSEGRTVLYGAGFDTSDVVLDHLTFTENQVNGALVEAWDGSIVLRHSVFTKNRPHPKTHKYGTLIDLQDDVAADVTNNIFYDNLFADDTACLFSGTEGLEMIVRNNIFGGFRNCVHSVSGGDTTIFSNNMVGHNECLMSLGAPAELSYNLYWDSHDGGDPAYGDLGGWPAFVDLAGRDFTLRGTSIAIDAGDPAILDADGTRSDIGAYGGPYGEW